jgi:hypothetical protein
MGEHFGTVFVFAGGPNNNCSIGSRGKDVVSVESKIDFSEVLFMVFILQKFSLLMMKMIPHD